MKKICETCGGTGRVERPGPPPIFDVPGIPCARCKGVGKVFDPMNGMIGDDRPILFISRDGLLNGPIEDRPEYQDNLSAVRAELEKVKEDAEKSKTDLDSKYIGTSQPERLANAILRSMAILDGES